LSNITTGNPFVIDTAGAGNIVASMLRVYAVLWDVGTTGAADGALSITDKNDAVKFAAHSSAKNENIGISFPDGIVFEGLRVPTKGSGVVYIYCQNVG